jgi:hypothetical protein
LISVPLIVCRGLRFGKLASPDVVRGVALVLMLFCSVLPAAAIEVSGATSSVWAALPSPFLAIDRLDGDPARAKTEAAVLLGVLALALTVAADRVLVARERRAG